ncbi:unnamed protein product, partial [Didymodactylos carnosus]
MNIKTTVDDEETVDMKLTTKNSSTKTSQQQQNTVVHNKLNLQVSSIKSELLSKVSQSQLVSTVFEPIKSENQRKSKKPKNTQQHELRIQQMKDLKDKDVRATPGGYFGLISDMKKDYDNFTRKGTFNQMEQLKPLMKQAQETQQLIERFNEETRFEEKKIEKSKAPFALNGQSITFSLPICYSEFKKLTMLEYLLKYGKPLVNRQQVALKSIRKVVQREQTLDVTDAKDVLIDYYNAYKTHQDIEELFNFLEISSNQIFDIREIVFICCYSERYFLHQLTKTEHVYYEPSLQEKIDFEFLHRKLDELKLSDSLKR